MEVLFDLVVRDPIGRDASRGFSSGH